MTRSDSYFACRDGKASVERFLLAQQEWQMIVDARGYMGEHWTLPYNCGVVEAAVGSSPEQTETEQTEIGGPEMDIGGEASAFDGEE